MELLILLTGKETFVPRISQKKGKQRDIIRVFFDGVFEDLAKENRKVGRSYGTRDQLIGYANWNDP